ncbi:MAG TPA: tetratricopeptide repeat protein [Armatimonadota bacterium]|jgi:tetratricopeptide (TPR) repeat protein
MRVRVRLFTALSLLLLFACPVRAQTTAPTAADLGAAYQLFKAGKATEALAKYKAILAANPKAELQQQALFWSGIVQESSGLDDDAIATFELLSSTSPDYRWPEVLHKLTMRYHAKGDAAKEKYFLDQLKLRRGASSARADRARADLLIGDYFKQTGNWTAAYQQFQSIQSSYPEHAQDILFQIAYTAHSAGKYTEAITAGQSYVNKYPATPQFEEAAFRVVEDLGYADRYKEAIDYLDGMAVSYPNLTARIRVYKAEAIAEGIKDPQASMKIAQQVIDENRDPYQVYLAKYRIAFTLQNQLRQPLKARDILAEILPLYPKDNLAIEIASDIASTYSVQGDYLQAAARYKEALVKYPCPVPEWDAWIRYAIGRQYVLAKDRVSAKKSWDELGQMHPGNEWLQLALKEISTWPR